MFQDALCRHPQIQTVAYSPHTYLETHHWLKGTVLLDMPAKRDPKHGIYSGYGTKANARTYLIDCIRGNIPDFELPKTDKELIFKGWEALCEKFAQPVFFEKSPQYLGFPASLDLLLEWVQTTHFQVKFIGLTRNPISVQYSAWQLFHRDPNDRQYGWMELQQEMLAFAEKLHKDQFLHVKYEQIIDEPELTFECICQFIGVEPHASVTKAVHSKSLTKWKEDPYFQIELSPEVHAFAKQFGYTDGDLHNPEKPPQPLSWRLRKRIEAFYRTTRAKMVDRCIKPIRLRMKRSPSE